MHIELGLQVLFESLCCIFWIMTPCSLVGGNQRSGGTYRLYFHGRSLFETLFDMMNRPNETKEK
jgi:hypothetical protein